MKRTAPATSTRNFSITWRQNWPKLEFVTNCTWAKSRKKTWMGSSETASPAVWRKASVRMCLCWWEALPHYLLLIYATVTCAQKCPLFKGEVGIKEEEGKTKKKGKKKEEEHYPNSWLVTTIYKTFKWILLESAFFKLLQDVLAFASPQLLKWVWDEWACFHPKFDWVTFNFQQNLLDFLNFCLAIEAILSKAAFTIFCPHTSRVSHIGSLLLSRKHTFMCNINRVPILRS